MGDGSSERDLDGCRKRRRDGCWVGSVEDREARSSTTREEEGVEGGSRKPTDAGEEREGRRNPVDEEETVPVEVDPTTKGGPAAAAAASGGSRLAAELLRLPRFLLILQ